MNEELSKAQQYANEKVNLEPNLSGEFEVYADGEWYTFRVGPRDAYWQAEAVLVETGSEPPCLWDCPVCGASTFCDGGACPKGHGGWGEDEISGELTWIEPEPAEPSNTLYTFFNGHETDASKPAHLRDDADVFIKWMGLPEGFRVTIDRPERPDYPHTYRNVSTASVARLSELLHTRYWPTYRHITPNGWLGFSNR